MSDENKSLDVLGIKPVADSVNTVTKGTVDGASAFLSRICLPAAEEFGFLLRDKVSAWRSKNAVAIANKAQKLLENQVQGLVLSAHPRIIYSSIENGSWAEDDFMQNLWAGLLASSCTPDGKDESNLILIGLLSQLTSSQAKIITHVCSIAKTYKSKSGFIACDFIQIEADELIQISGITDIHQLDRELDHLRGLELINEGFHPDHMRANVTPHALCLQLFVRAQGYVGSPIDYFGAVEKSPNK
ncbi:Abi-alpha family protein [Pseudoalteromonas rhizosphaerae]|uniref:Abi-alpha family protein n=1 Tax=Pseudoalteromonas rhizosphaerae TaxID=2518973 RepID=UPI00384AE3FC